MFVQGKVPPLLFSRDRLCGLTVALHNAGYEQHKGPRIIRTGEVIAFRRCFDGALGLRQVHVQVVSLDTGLWLGAFAHTEPYGYGIHHVISAVCDKANFGAGAAVLLRDLKNVKFIE